MEDPKYIELPKNTSTYQGRCYNCKHRWTCTIHFLNGCDSFEYRNLAEELNQELGRKK